MNNQPADPLDPQGLGSLAGPPAQSPASPPPETDPTASGLHERDIDPADLAALQAQFTFSSIAPGVATEVEVIGGWQLPQGLDKRAVQTAALAIAEVKSARMRLAPLPDRVRVHHERLGELRPKLHRDLAPALAQPIRRDRTSLELLSKAEEQAVLKAVVAKYGSAAKQLRVQGIFREVPLEAAKSVRLDDSLRFCVFTLPPGVPVHKLHSGYALVVTVGESGKTYPLLVRL